MARMQVAGSTVEIQWSERFNAWLVYLNGRQHHGCHYTYERAALHAEGLADDLRLVG